MRVRRPRLDGNVLRSFAHTYAGAQALCISSTMNAAYIVITTVSGWIAAVIPATPSRVYGKSRFLTFDIFSE